MADRDFFQTLTGEALDFLDSVGSVLGDDMARKAVLRDLGVDPSTAPAAPALPSGQLDAIRAYRDASHPSAEAAIAALADVAAMVDVVVAWAELVPAGADGVDDFVDALLDLLLGNWFRLRYPRLWLVLQSVNTLEELGSTYGPGNNNAVRVGRALWTLLRFVWQPGRSIEDFAAAQGDAPIPDYVSALMELYLRGFASLVSWFDKEDQLEFVKDEMTGWDTRGLDFDSTEPLRRSDVVASRMTSFSFGGDSHRRRSEPANRGRVNVTFAMVHEAEGGPALFVALGGSAAYDTRISDRWALTLRSQADAAVAMLIGAKDDMFQMAAPAGVSYQFDVGLAATPPRPSPNDPAPPQVAYSFPSSVGSRIDFGQLALTLSFNADRAELLLSVTDGALRIEPGDTDSFMGELLGKTPLRLPFNLTIGYSSKRGLVLEGGPGSDENRPPLSGAGNVGPPVIAATIPIGRAIGPLTIHEVGVRLALGMTAAQAVAQPSQIQKVGVELDASFSAQIGPVYFRVDQLGLKLTIDGERPRAERNLRLVDLRAGAKFPRGIAVHVESALIAGGGSIMHDPDQGIYFGVLDLAFRGGMTLQAICLVGTHFPDGTKGFSLVAILTIQLGNPYPLGMGFFLEGFGGILALHRKFDETAARAALPTGQLRNVLFPADPVHHTAEILRSLQTLFPVRRGSHLFGVLVKIGWASPTLVHFELGVMYEWGRGRRLILLGRVSAILPRTDLAVIKLNMDAIGVLDFDAGTFALDAVLHDSKLCGRFVITGGMAMRMGWKDSPGFALSVGGMHPKFAVPAGFPTVARLQIALTDGDNPKLICRSYFAITSNTIQWGANASLYAGAFGFSIEGEIGYDVLIQLIPFHFLADFRASVQLKRGSHNLFKVSVAGEIEGPLPLRVAGKATFEILWCDFSVKFNKTLVDGGVPNDLPLVDALGLLVAALSETRAWQAQLPAASTELVSLRRPASAGIALHPLGALTVRQTAVPLGLSRDIDRVGTATPSGDRRFAITGATLGTASPPRHAVTELFAPAQFFDMTDDDRLAAPSFSPMAAGVTFGDGGYTAGPGEGSPFAYTDITVGHAGEPVLEPEPHRPDGASVLMMTMRSASATSRVRRTLDRRFAAPVRPAAPVVARDGWAAVRTDGGAPPSDTSPDATLTWAEARGVTNGNRAAWVLVPRSEVTVP
jgi:hypothetical protein